MASSSKILVTGGAGYIGSHTVVELFQAGFTPIIVDDFRNSMPWIIERLMELTSDELIHYKIDCSNPSAFRKVFTDHPDIKGLIHFAADKAVGESVENPLKYYQNNVGSLCTVLELMKEFNIQNFVFSSSCTVYGEPKEIPVTENAPIQLATSPYGDTKIIGERIINAEQKSGLRLKGVLLRYFNPIGAHSSGRIGELPQGVPNNLIPYITQTAKGIREKLTVFGKDYDTVDGTNIRDYIHVVDLAKAHVAALNYADNREESFCQPFNVGTGKGTTVLEIIRGFEEVAGLKLNYSIGDRRPGDVVAIYAAAEYAEEELSWKAQLSVKKALEDSWNWEQNGIKE